VSSSRAHLKLAVSPSPSVMSRSSLPDLHICQLKSVDETIDRESRYRIWNDFYVKLPVHDSMGPPVQQEVPLFGPAGPASPRSFCAQ
jgi:hypothetical protein